MTMSRQSEHSGAKTNERARSRGRVPTPVTRVDSALSEPHVSNRLVRGVYEQVARQVGAERAMAVFEACGMDATYVSDTERWVSMIFVDRLSRQLARDLFDLGDLPDATHPLWELFRDAARLGYRPESLGPAWHVLRAAGSPATVFRQLPRLVERVNRMTRLEVVQQGPGLCVLRCEPMSRDWPDNPGFCRARIGSFEGIPTIWGRPLAHVEHRLCMHDPDTPADHCLYVVTYEERWAARWLGPLAAAATGAALVSAGTALLPGATPLGLAALLGAALGLAAEGWRRYLAAARTRREHVDQLYSLIDLVDGRYRAIRESESRFRDLAVNIREVFWLVTPELDHIIYLSPAFEEITGRSTQEVQARPSLLVDAIHPDDLAKVTAKIRGLRQDSEELQFRIIRPDGGVRSVRARGFPVRDSQGRIARVAGIGEDITDQLRSHDVLKEREDQLRQAQKLEAVGQLAAGIAHDFNNHLTVIQLTADLVRSELTDGHESTPDIEVIAQAARDAAALTQQLLAFGRRQLFRLRVVDVNELLVSAARMLRRLIGERHELTLTTGGDICPVMADETQLTQVLMNLAVNARDAMPDGGKLLIETRGVCLAEGLGHHHGRVPAGRYALIRVSDTGIGIPDAVLDNIFEPFFTTKDVSRGTGLGLATAHGIVQQHCGGIACRSVPGQGTTFDIYIPCTDEQPAPESPDAAQQHKTPHAAASILVVEDDPTLRQVVMSALGSVGHKVIACKSAEEALRLDAATLRGLDLVFTDLVMPGSSGIEVAAAIAERHPTVKVLYTSGYAADELQRLGQATAPVELLQKPYTISQLVARIQRSLAS